MPLTLERPVAAKPIVIEVAGQKLGVVFPRGRKYRFVAVKLPAFAIDGQEFDSVDAAQTAARAALETPVATAV